MDKATRQPSQERGCNGKANLGRKYQKSANKLAERHGKRYGVYLCPHCDGFHLTTKLQNADQYEPLLYVTPWVVLRIVSTADSGRIDER